MDQVEVEKFLTQIPKYREYSEAVSRGIHDIVLSGGKPLRRVADFFHGSWLGHPLHPVLTDVVIGAWSFASVLDAIAALKGSRAAAESADRLTAIGVAAAVPTAVAGLTDYTTIPRRAMSTGATHGLLNTIGLGVYLLSALSRRNGQRERGVFLSALGLGMMLVSAWLGGELSFRYAVGVKKHRYPAEPKDWTAVIDESELNEQEPKRVEAASFPVLLYRYGGTIYAMGAVCGHDGGPLEEGKFDGLCVECPWHQSVYDLRDGGVVHGPTTYAEPSYDTRILNGRIEVRLRDERRASRRI